MLLLEDRETLLASLPQDSSPQIAQLVKLANPLKSFSELEVESGVPLEQLLRLASHLTYWGKAAILNTITKNSVYKVAANAPLDTRSEPSLQFLAAFPKYGKSLPQVLEEFSRPRRVLDHLQALSTAEQLPFAKVLVREGRVGGFHYHPAC